MILINLTNTKADEWSPLQKEEAIIKGFQVIDIEIDKILDEYNSIIEIYTKIKNLINGSAYSVLVENPKEYSHLLRFFTFQKIPIYEEIWSKDKFRYNKINNFNFALGNSNIIDGNEQAQKLRQYIWDNNKLQICAIGSIAFLAIVFYIFSKFSQVKSIDGAPNFSIFNTDFSTFLHWGFWEPIVGFSTLIVAIFVWFNEQKENFMSNMQKKLYVKYVYKNKVVAFIRNATLSNEGDIRAYGQTVGAQILFKPKEGGGRENLHFEVKFDIDDKLPIYQIDNNEIFKPYEIILYLKASKVIDEPDPLLPDKLQETYPLDLCLEYDVLFEEYSLTPLKAF